LKGQLARLPTVDLQKTTHVRVRPFINWPLSKSIGSFSRPESRVTPWFPETSFKDAKHCVKDAKTCLKGAKSFLPFRYFSKSFNTRLLDFTCMQRIFTV